MESSELEAFFKSKDTPFGTNYELYVSGTNFSEVCIRLNSKELVCRRSTHNPDRTITVDYVLVNSPYTEHRIRPEED